MYIHSKYFTHKLKFAAQAAHHKSFPEFYKFVAIEYDETDNCLYLRSFNQEIHLRTRLGVCEDDSVVMPNTNRRAIGCFDHNIALKSWSKVDDQLMISVDYKKMTIDIKSSRARAQEAMISANAFVEFPDYGSYKDVQSPIEFAKCIRTVQWAADKTNIDIRCKGIFMTNRNGFLELAATDRNAIAISSSDDNIGLINIEGMVSLDSAAIIESLMASKKDCEIASAEDGLSVTCDDDEVACRFFDEDMVNYDSVVEYAENTPNQAVIRVSRGHLEEAVGFIAPYCDLDKVKIVFNGTEATVIGEIKDRRRKGRQKFPYICDEGDASGASVHTTTARVLDAIKHLEADEIRLKFPSEKPRQMFIFPESSEGDIDTMILSMLLNPESVSQPPPEKKNRKKKRRRTHRDD